MGTRAVPALAGAVRAWHDRDRGDDLALRRARRADDMGCRHFGAQPGVHAGRGDHHDPADPGVHRLVVLGVPRESRHRGLSLMPAPRIAADDSPLWKRHAWMAAIWAASVAALGAVAWILELWIGA